MSKNKSLTVMFSAGESSGEQHAASMFLEMKKRLPGIEAFGMGGIKMRQAGVDVQVDSSAIGVIGLVEVLKHYGEIRQALATMKNLVQQKRPDLLVCVDYKEFNLKLAQFAKKQGVKVLFYVSPQVWAWRPGRVVTYGKAIDMMAVIFPFETQYYRAKNVPVSYVGHPSIDKVLPTSSRQECFQHFQLDQTAPVIGLLPGSRSNEIKRMLPVMLEAAEQLLADHPGMQFLMAQADSVHDDLLQPYLQQTDLPIKCIKGQPYDVVQCCDAVMTTSGTATLEIALLTIPMVIAYKLSPLTYWLGRLLVKTPFIGLPNIIAGKGIVRELIQDDVNAANLAEEVEHMLQDSDYRQTMIRELLSVKRQLGEGGGSKKMAELALQMLTQEGNIK